MADPGLDPVGHTGESVWRRRSARVDPRRFVRAWNFTGPTLHGREGSSPSSLRVLIGVVRVMQGQTLRYVGWSVAAVVVAGVFATRTGRAQDAFLPGMLQSGFTAAVRREQPHPLAGSGSSSLQATQTWLAPRPGCGSPGRSKEGQGRPGGDGRTCACRGRGVDADTQALTHVMTAWHRHDGIVRVASRLGWVLVGLAVVRLSIQIPLYLQGQVEALGVAKLVLGWPAYLLAVGVGAMVLLRGHAPWTRRGPTDPAGR